MNRSLKHQEHREEQHDENFADRREIEALESAFWQAIVDGDATAATALLTEPALMISGHGISRFDHAGYRKMADNAAFKLKSFELSKMDIVFPTLDMAIAAYHVSQSVEVEGKPLTMEANDSSTWVRLDVGWKCVSHTESQKTDSA